MNTQISNPSADDEATIRALYQQLIETPNVAKAYSCSSSALAGALSEYLALWNRAYDKDFYKPYNRKKKVGPLKIWEMRESVDMRHTNLSQMLLTSSLYLMISCMDPEFSCVPSLLSSFSLIVSTRIVQFGTLLVSF